MLPVGHRAINPSLPLSKEAACTFIPHSSWMGDSTPGIPPSPGDVTWAVPCPLPTPHPRAQPALSSLSLCLQDGDFPCGGRGGPEGVPGAAAAQPPSHRKHPHAPARGHQHVCSVQLPAQRYHVLLEGKLDGDQPLPMWRRVGGIRQMGRWEWWLDVCGCQHKGTLAGPWSWLRCLRSEEASHPPGT